MANSKELTRRAALIGGAAGVTAAGFGALGHHAQLQQAADGRVSATANGSRMPVVFLPHGGGPWPWVDLGLDHTEVERLSDYLRSLRNLPKAAPRALLVVSAHWEEKLPTVMTAAQPPMLYDYYDFPPESYRITWRAPGHPELASQVRALLEQAGFATAADAERGFDHGTFVPLKLTYPDAELPVVQLSLKVGLDPAEHLAIGRALSPLRDEGVFIVGSGMSFHNMRGFRSQNAREMSEPFDTWLRATLALEPEARTARLERWSEAKGARIAHPREEHLLPLMVVAGAAGDDKATLSFEGTMMGAQLSAYAFG
jgi:aromatic ring-opening dioxygenase catalytic subunit (LigB family)